MSKTYLAIIFAFVAAKAHSQKSAGAVELTSYLQYEHFPAVSVQVNSTVATRLEMNGISWGCRGSYKFPLNKTLFLKTGIGFHKYNFGQVRNENSLFGRRENRPIIYSSGSSTFGYVCDKYSYNNATLNIGIQKALLWKENIILTAGFEMTNFFTFSQRYNIPGTNNDTKYKKNDSRYFGYSFGISAQLLKELGQIRIGPGLSIPIFNLWKQDSTFPNESNEKFRTKWTNSIVLSLTCVFDI